MSQPPLLDRDSDADQESSSEEALLEERRSTPPLRTFKATKRPHSPEQQHASTKSVHFQSRTPVSTCPSSSNPSMTSPTMAHRPRSASQDLRSPLVQYHPDSKSVERVPTSAFSTQFIVHPSASAILPPAVFMQAHGEVLPPGTFFAAPMAAYGQGHRVLPHSSPIPSSVSTPVYTTHEGAAYGYGSTTPGTSTPWSDGRQASLSSSTDQLTTSSSLGSAPGAITARSPHHHRTVPPSPQQRATEAFPGMHLSREHRGTRFPSAGSLSSISTPSVGPRPAGPLEMHPETYTIHPAPPTPQAATPVAGGGHAHAVPTPPGVAAAAAAAVPAGYSMHPEYTTIAATAVPAGAPGMEQILTLPYQSHLVREMRTNAAIRLPAMPRPEEGHCQAGGELRLSQLKHCGQKIHVPAGCALVGCRSPQLGQTTLLATVDKRYLPDPHTGSNVQGFHGNCIGCGKTGFHFFTDFCTHINLRLNTQPKKQKHIRYYIDMDDNGSLKTGTVVPWKGSSTLLLFTSGANRGTTGSESDDATSPDHLGSIHSGSSAGKEAVKYSPHAGIEPPAKRPMTSTPADHPPALAPASIQLATPQKMTTSPPLPKSQSVAQRPTAGQQPSDSLASSSGMTSAMAPKRWQSPALLPCFGHSADIIQDISASLLPMAASTGEASGQPPPPSPPQECVWDFFEQPLSTVDELCHRYRGASPGLEGGDTEYQQAAAFVSEACFLLGSFLLTNTSFKILLREAFTMYMHRGLVASRQQQQQQQLKTANRPMDCIAVRSTLLSLAASSNDVLSVSTSSESLMDAVQKGVRNSTASSETAAQQQPCRPDFTICIYSSSDSVFDMQVCVVLQSMDLLAKLQDNEHGLQPAKETGIHDLYEVFVGMQLKTGMLQQSSASPLQQLPVRTYGQPSDPAGPLNLPSPSRDSVCLSQHQLQVASNLANKCYEQMVRQLKSIPGQSYDMIDFIILVRQSCPVYVEMVQRLIQSRAVEELLQSRGVSPVHVAEVARERVICVDSEDHLLAMQLAKLGAYALGCPRTLFLVIAKDCMKSPVASGTAHGQLDNLLALPNTFMICSMMSHYSWLATNSLLPEDNIVELCPDASTYHGLKQLLHSHTWFSNSITEGDQKWMVDEAFESTLTRMKPSVTASAHLMSESELRTFQLLQEYVLAWDHLRSGQHQRQRCVSQVTDDIIGDLMHSKVPASSIVRIPHQALALFFWNQLCSVFHGQHRESSSNLSDDILLALYDGQGPIRVCQKVRGSTSFLSPESPRPPSASSIGGQCFSQVSSLRSLPAGRVLLVLAGSVTSLHIPMNVRFIDYRGHGRSYLTRADIQEELSLMHGYSQPSHPSTTTPTSVSRSSSTPTRTHDHLPCMAVLSVAMLLPVSAVVGSKSDLPAPEHILYGIQNLLPCERLRWLDGIHRRPLVSSQQRSALAGDQLADETAYYRMWCRLRCNTAHAEQEAAVDTEPPTKSPKLWLLMGPAKSGKAAILLETLRLLIDKWVSDRQPSLTTTTTTAAAAATTMTSARPEISGQT